MNSSVIDAVEREYVLGATTYELGDKYGVDHTTISKWMRKRGHHRRNDGAQFDKSRKRQHAEHKARFIERFSSEYGGDIEYVGNFGGNGKPVVFRCCKCGHEWKRTNVRDVFRYRMRCPACKDRKKAERKLTSYKVDETARDAARRERRRAEYAKDKVCNECGCVFHSESPQQKYCTPQCRFRHLNHLRANQRKRARKFGVDYEKGITLSKLIERDGNVCQLCGELCDETDKQWGNHGPTYPTIDHIIPMALGGGHVWSNVQLAHMLCNLHKGIR